MKRIFSIVICYFLFLPGLSIALAQNFQLVTQSGHSDWIWAVAFSPDGKILASGSNDRTVKLWDVASGKELRTLQGHSLGVVSVSFGPDGKTLATGSAYDTVKLWNVEDGRLIGTLEGFSREAETFAFSPDGKLLAVGTIDGTVKIWDLQRAKELGSVHGYSSAVVSLAFHPGGKILAGGDRDGSLKLWSISDDLSNIKEIFTLKGHSESINAVAFSSDGTMLASGGGDRSVRVWDVSTGKEIFCFTGHKDAVLSLAFNPRTRMLAGGSSDHTVILWDLYLNKEIRKLEGFSCDVDSLAFNPEGNLLAIGCEDSRIILWDISTIGGLLEPEEEVRKLEGHSNNVSSVIFSPDGKILASRISKSVSGKYKESIKLWSLETGRELPNLEKMEDNFAWVEAIEEEKNEWIGSMAFSFDGKFLAASSASRVKLWNVCDGIEYQVLQDKSGDLVSAMAFSPDNRLLAAGRGSTIKIWDVYSGKEKLVLDDGLTNVVSSLVFSPSGKTLASGIYRVGEEKEIIKLWDVDSGRKIMGIEDSSEGTTFLVFNSDGKTLASGNETTDKVKLWDVDSGKELFSLKASPPICFSPDGKSLVTGSEDNSLKLWDISNGKLIFTLKGHSNHINSASFSPDGKIIATAGDDRKIKLWDVAARKELASLISFDENDWAVVMPSYRFDASLRGMKLLYFVARNKPVDLFQLKECYYEPGLLAKITGFNKEPFRDISFSLNELNFFPETTVEAPGKDNQLKIKLSDQGGGIGSVQVFVNNKEIVRKPEILNSTGKEVTLKLDLSGVSVIPGQKNIIRIVTWNKEGYLSNGGVEIPWIPVDIKSNPPAELYAVIAGVSNYSSPDMKLHFPDTDAENMAKVIELGGKTLFGSDKVHINLFSTSGRGNSIMPTKSNLQKAFEDLKKARPSDIIVVYLTGYGINISSPRDTCCYLTQDAAGIGMSDKDIRRQCSITTDELLEWFNQSPAQKQVLILDTYAGVQAESLNGYVPGDQIRALEELRERTGSYILMSYVSDVSRYDTSRADRGFLVRALLKGIKGDALRDNEFLDVLTLFRYISGEVTQMASETGITVNPLIIIPTEKSFDMGRFTEEEKKMLP